MEKVENSGFALYPDLDLVRKELIKKLHDIGFVQCIEKPNYFLQNKNNHFTSSSNGTAIRSKTNRFHKM